MDQVTIDDQALGLRRGAQNKRQRPFVAASYSAFYYHDSNFRSVRPLKTVKDLCGSDLFITLLKHFSQVGVFPAGGLEVEQEILDTEAEIVEGIL